MPAAEHSDGAQGGPRPAPRELAIGEAGGAAEMAACFAIRRAVFCVEQGVPETLEIDGRDAQCRHFLLRLGGQAAGTARVRPLDPGIAKIERVAILARHRGRGLGSALMRHVLASLDGQQRAAVLHAQAHSETFYRALGFATEGAPFEEAGIPHVRMTRKSRPPGN